MATVTWNPDDKEAEIVLSDGNLTATPVSSSSFCRVVRATRAKLGGGRWYFECYGVSYFLSNPTWGVGLVTANHVLLGSPIGLTFEGVEYLEEGIGLHAGANLDICDLGSLPVTNSSYLPSVLENCTIGVAYDLFSGDVWFSKNGAWVGGGTPNIDATPAASGLIVGPGTLPIYPACNGYNWPTSGPVTAHFSEASFSYTPPPGFRSIEYPEYDYLGDGSISGVVKELANGTYVPGAYPVYVYSRDTGEILSATMSNEDGSYTLYNLPMDAEVYVMAIDNSSPIQRSAIVDKVVAS